MQATVIYANNPFDPARDRKQVQVHRHSSLQKLAPKTQSPFVCIVNGAPVLRANAGWQRTVDDGDVVAFITLPQGGGGGSNPMRIILMVGLAVFAPQLGIASMGKLAAVEAFGGISYGALAGGLIGFAGTALINALIPPPKMSSTASAQNSAAASPTYNLSAQGNSARIGQAIPVLYGKHLIYPDFAAEPYTEYVGNEQYLYQLFCVGQGEYAITDLRIEDTAITNFAEVTYEVVNPGANVSLFPSNVITATEVSGQELLTNAAIGPFICNPPTTQTNTIAVDIVAPRGLYYANDDGGLNSVGVAFKIEARTVDDAGAATGSWVVLGAESFSAATGTPQRKSYRYPVTKARYEVKVTRTDTKKTSSRYGHEISWTSLRAYIPDGQQYGDLTMLAVRMRASNNISSQSARRINCIAQRKLPIWNGSSWSANTATRSICWALADALRAGYGGSIPDARIDLAQLLALDTILTARGDTFDGIFDQKQVLWESLTLIARAGRMKPYVQGGMYHFTRDGAASLPVALFNQRNIVKNSMKVEYLLPSDETADSVMVTYFDEVRQKPLEILAQLPGYSADNPYPIDLFGVTNSDQAWREGRYIAAANRYRRQSISFTTEMEGFIPTFGDLIAISHDRMQRNVSGDVLAYDAGTKVLTLSEPVTFGAGSYYFGFKLRDGSFSGPWLAMAGADEYHPVLTVGLDFTPDTGMTREKTSFTFGKGEEYRKLARVLSVRPRSIHQVEIVCINEDAAVHTADTGTAPPPSSYWDLPAKITRPLVTGLSVTLSGTPSNPQLAIDWQPAAGADHYYIETSYDNGSSWQRRGEVSSANILVTAQRGTVYVRVAAVGLTRGDWVEWVGDPFSVPPPDVASFLVSVQSDGTRQFDMAMTTALPPDFAGYEIRYKSGSGAYTWAEMTKMNDGLITSSPFENNQIEAGLYTFAVKAVDTSNIYSENATFIVADLAEQRLAGVLYSQLPRNYGWPGTKTNCFVSKDNANLTANDNSEWSDLTTWDAWTQWPNDPASPIIYQHPTIDLGNSVPIVPVITAIADGTVVLEERHSADGITFTDWAVAGGLLNTRFVDIRATVSGALPILRSLNIQLSGNSLTEEVNDLNTALLAGDFRLGVGDVRIPFGSPFLVISQMQITLQNVGPGWSVEVIDKDVATGPRIKIYNADYELADAMIDVFFRGF
jgi:hypothetical protein